MKYSDYRKNINSGDILVWKHRAGWLSSWYDFKVNLVKFFTKSEYTHVAVAWVVGERVMIIESVVPLIRINPLSNDLPCFVIPGDGLSEEQLAKALELVGKGEYSMSECMLAFLGDNDRLNNEWECAEFTSYILGLECVDTPAKVVEYLLSKGKTLVELT